MHDVGEFVFIIDEIIMLRARPGDADRVAFLKRICTDHVPRDLARNADEGNGIHHGVGEAVTALVAPGPEVTRTTPGLPVERA